MVRIGFDGEALATGRTGLGVYSRNLLADLARLAPEHELFAFTPRAPEPDLAREIDPKVVVRIGAPHGIDLFHGLDERIPSGLQVPAVVTIHDLIAFSHPEWYSRVELGRRREGLADAVHRAGLILTVSDATAQLIRARFGREDVLVTGQTVGPAFRRPMLASEREQVRAKYSLPPRYLVSVGTLMERKNQLGLIQAFLRAKPPAELVLAAEGSGPYAESVRKAARAKGVHLIGQVPQSELPAVYAGADLCAQVSWMEGFGIPVLEALTVGIPAMVTRGSAQAEVAGEAGVLVDPEVEGIAEGIAAFYADPQIGQHLRSAASKEAARYSPEKVTARVLEGYRRAVSERHP